jgi:uncharacterized membrane protein YkvA (DUF1232 family)
MTWIENLKKRGALLKRDTLALMFAYKDARTPWYAKGFAALVVAYAFSPIDLIPDFIPVLGYLDDLILIPVGIALSLKMIPLVVMADARLWAERHMRDRKPTSWWMAALIILVWIAVITAFGLAICKAVRCK